jgi:hypothetical protein
MKRIENAMVENDIHEAVPSYFVECLVYNCPDTAFHRSSWVETTRSVIFEIWEGLQGEEPAEDHQRWNEVNECFYLFHAGQPWSRWDGRQFAHAAWNYLELG